MGPAGNEAKLAAPQGVCCRACLALGCKGLGFRGLTCGSAKFCLGRRRVGIIWSAESMLKLSGLLALGLPPATSTVYTWGLKDFMLK